MSMLFRAQGSDPRAGTDDALKIFDHWEPPSRYLTDGTSLYRYIGAVPSGTSEIVALENCESLKIVLFSIEELGALELCTVVIGASA